MNSLIQSQGTGTLPSFMTTYPTAHGVSEVAPGDHSAYRHACHTDAATISEEAQVMKGNPGVPDDPMDAYVTAFQGCLAAEPKPSAQQAAPQQPSPQQTPSQQLGAAL